MSVSKWAYSPEKCDGDYCPGDCDGCPKAVETNLFDIEEIHPNCTVQVLKNSITGETSVGWIENGGRMRVMLDDGAIMPKRAYPTDAGLDLMTPERVKIWPGTAVTINTGVHIELPPGFFGKIESKSGLNTKHQIVCCGGTIDEPYRGAIAVTLYNFGKTAYVFEPGDKIAQLVIQQYLAPELILADSLTETDRGESGFGSTGR